MGHHDRRGRPRPRARPDRRPGCRVGGRRPGGRRLRRRHPGRGPRADQRDLLGDRDRRERDPELAFRPEEPRRGHGGPAGLGGRAGGGHRQERGDLRRARLPGLGGRGPGGHVLRPGHESRRHLLHRRDRHLRLLRRRRSGDLGRTRPAGRAGPRPLRQPADRGFPGLRGAGGRGPDGHVLRPGHEGRRHLHHRRDRHLRLLRRRRPRNLGRAFRPRRGDHRPGRERGRRGHR